MCPISVGFEIDFLEILSGKGDKVGHKNRNAHGCYNRSMLRPWEIAEYFSMGICVFIES